MKNHVELNLPSQSILEKIDDLYPGASQLLIKAIIEEHYRDKLIESERYEIDKHFALEDKKLTIEYNFRRFTLYIGLFIATSAFGLGAYGIHIKADLNSIALLIAPIAALAGVFIWSKPKKSP